MFVLTLFFSGQHRLFREFLVSRRPAGSFNPREYLINSKSTTMGKVRDLLYDVIQLRVRQLFILSKA